MKQLCLILIASSYFTSACDDNGDAASDAGAAAPGSGTTDDSDPLDFDTTPPNNATDPETPIEITPVDQTSINREAAFDKLDTLGPCVNLGNWLEAPNQDWGVTCDQADIDRIAAIGFETIRIPIRWETRSSSQAPYAIDDSFFALIDSVLDWCEAAGVNAVVNMHHHDAFFEDPSANKAWFLSMWDQIAARYRDRPSSVIFEIMNEPNTQLTAELWNVYLRDALDVIRTTNPNRFVVIGTADWGGLGAMDKLLLPGDPNIIFTFHYYEPRQFTHQGAQWAEGADEWVGTLWEGTALEKLAVKNAMSSAVDWADRNNVPVWMGEFGSFEAADDASRARWSEHVARFAEDAGFGWCYWEYKAGFGVWDRTDESWNTFLTDALFNDDYNIIDINLDELGENILANGDFENGSDGWRENFYGGEATSAVVDGVLTINVTQESEQPWEVQYIADLPPLGEGQAYSVLFDIWSDAPRGVYCGVQHMADPWNIHGDSSISVTTSPITQVLNFTASEDDDTAGFVLNLGDATGTVYVDNVRIIAR